MRVPRFALISPGKMKFALIALIFSENLDFALIKIYMP